MSSTEDQAAKQAAEILLGDGALSPRVGLVLGSGLAGVAEALGLKIRRAVEFAALPGLGAPTTPGHQGTFLLGTVRGVPVLVQQGRWHCYEGLSAAQAAFPVRVQQAAGVETIVLTGAAGGLRRDLGPGDLVLILDHLNLIGDNPLVPPGPGGPEHVDLAQCYDAALNRCLVETAGLLGIPLAGGVYGAVRGPSFETPAEARMLRTLGADLVAMSVVPEAIQARALGMRVVGLCYIANRAAESGVHHGQVLRLGHAVAPRLGALLEGFIGAEFGERPATP